MLNYLPYTNFQDTNLDWMLKTMQDLPDTINTAIENAMQHVVFLASYDPETETLILESKSEVDYAAKTC